MFNEQYYVNRSKTTNKWLRRGSFFSFEIPSGGCLQSVCLYKLPSSGSSVGAFLKFKKSHTK